MFSHTQGGGPPSEELQEVGVEVGAELEESVAQIVKHLRCLASVSRL